MERVRFLQHAIPKLYAVAPTVPGELDDASCNDLARSGVTHTQRIADFLQGPRHGPDMFGLEHFTFKIGNAWHDIASLPLQAGARSRLSATDAWRRGPVGDVGLNHV
jgi:hypothetical protein